MSVPLPCFQHSHSESIAGTSCCQSLNSPVTPISTSDLTLSGAMAASFVDTWDNQGEVSERFQATFPARPRVSHSAFWPVLPQHHSPFLPWRSHRYVLKASLSGPGRREQVQVINSNAFLEKLQLLQATGQPGRGDAACNLNPRASIFDKEQGGSSILSYLQCERGRISMTKNQRRKTPSPLWQARRVPKCWLCNDASSWGRCCVQCHGYQYTTLTGVDQAPPAINYKISAPVAST